MHRKDMFCNMNWRWWSVMLKHDYELVRQIPCADDTRQVHRHSIMWDPKLSDGAFASSSQNCFVKAISPLTFRNLAG